MKNKPTFKVVLMIMGDEALQTKNNEPTHISPSVMCPSLSDTLL